MLKLCIDLLNKQQQKAKTMKTKEEIQQRKKLLDECARAYRKLDNLTIENKMLKNEVKRLTKIIEKQK